MKLAKAQKLIANIIHLNIKGFGVAKLKIGSKNYNIAVDGCFPGDLVECQVYKSKKFYAEARPGKFYRYSEDRVEPKNNYAGHSGATPLEKLSYPKQLAYKELEVHRIMQNLNLQPKIHTIIAMDEPWYYRNKMQYSFGVKPDTFEFTLGLHHKPYRSKIVEVSKCCLCDPLCEKLIAFTIQHFKSQELTAYNFFENSGTLRNLTLRFAKNTEDKMLILEVSNCDAHPSIASYFQEIQRQFPAIKSAYLLNIKVQKGTKTQQILQPQFGPLYLHEQLKLKSSSLEFHILPLAFFQPNTQQAQVIYQTVLDLVSPGKIAYDLFCGTGTIGLFLSQKFQKVYGVEIEPQAVEIAIQNAKINHIQNTEFLCGDVYKILKEKQLPKAEVIVVDPPRSGLTPKALELIAEIQAPQLIYISCNLKSFASNAVELQDKGYKLETVVPVDQFPHTRHLEIVSKFTYAK